MRKLTTTVAVAAAVSSAFAKIEMGTPFSDGAVLQRGMEVPVWGRAEPGSKVTVEFADAKVSTTACAEGCWKVKLPVMEASAESRTMTVTEARSLSAG